MLRTSLFGSGLLACLIAGRVTAQQPGVATTAPAVRATPQVYFTAEEMPSFPGGEAAMLRFLSRKLQYPAEALDRSRSGKVYVSFVVDDAGHLRDPHVVKGLGYGLDEEALRLVRLMPWWNPGKIQGQPVWVGLTLPIVFRAL